MADLEQFWRAANDLLRAVRGPGHRAVRVVLIGDDGEEMELHRPPSHSPDFRGVQWFGRQYTFTPGQAAVVKLLWQAWESDNPEIGQEYLIIEAGLEAERLAALFRNHPAWGTMIAGGQGKGTFRLADPGNSQTNSPTNSPT